MKLSHVLGGCCNMVYDKEFPINSVILRLENGTTFVCTSFRQSRKIPLRVYCYMPLQQKWKITFLDQKLKHAMWDYHRQHERKRNKNKANYVQFMKHDRKHKHGSGGSLDSKHSITDYECTKNPMHDFRKSYYI